LNLVRIKTFNKRLVESEDDNALASVADTENWVNCNGHFDNPNDSKDDSAADNESN
jgi:hypothetical protein